MKTVLPVFLFFTTSLLANQPSDYTVSGVCGATTNCKALPLVILDASAGATEPFEIEGGSSAYTPAGPSSSSPGRRYIALGIHIISSGTSETCTIYLHNGSTNYTINQITTNGSADSGSGYALPVPYVLDGAFGDGLSGGTGDYFQLTCPGGSWNAWMIGAEVDSDQHAPFTRALVSSGLGSTVVTAYTVSANRHAWGWSSSVGVAWRYWNQSGGSETLTVYYVPSGGSPTGMGSSGSNEAYGVAVSGGSGIAQGYFAGGGGDSIQVSTSNTTVTQIFYVTVVETP